MVLVCPTGLEGFRVSFFQVLVCPKASGGFGLVLVCPTGLEGFRFFFQVLACPTGLEGFRIYFSSTGLPKGPGIFWLSTGLPNESGGVSDFFKFWFAQHVWRGFGFFFRVLVCPKASGVLAWYWSAQRVWKGFAFFQVLVCPTGLEGFRIYFSSTGLPKGPGIFWLSTGLPNESGGVSDFFKFWFAQHVWRGFGFFFRVLVCPKASGVLAWYWSAQRVWKGFAFFQVLVCPTGLEGFRIFFFEYWSAQRALGVSFFLKYWLAQRVRGVRF